MGFILLGLMTLNQIGLAGAVLQMFSHGILAGLLFAVVGRMVYARTHTRELAALGPMNLNKVLPFAAVTFVIAGMAAMGLPGFSGFVAELMILIGAWHAYPAARHLRRPRHRHRRRLHLARHAEGLLLRVDSSEPHRRIEPLPPITLPERLGAIILIAASVLIGLYPQMLLNIIIPALNSPLFDGLRKGSWQ